MEDGLLNLDEPLIHTLNGANNVDGGDLVGRWFRQAVITPNPQDWRYLWITPRMLLTHTSGLDRHGIGLHPLTSTLELEDFLLIDDMGFVHLFTPYSGVMLTGSNPLPAGAGVDMKWDHTDTFPWRPYVLGGAASPYVRLVFTYFIGGMPPPIAVSGLLPGDPRDMETVPTPTHAFIGSSCSGTTFDAYYSGPSGIGGTGAVGVSVYNLSPPALTLAVGTSTTQWGAIPLPLTLPGGCQLFISPDVLITTTATNSGASVPISIPNDPALIGVTFFGQWGCLAQAGTWVTSDAIAVQIW